MGKSASLRDIFTLKKGPTNGSFFLKPGQFLAHLLNQPSLQEIQRLQHILEGRQLAFIQRFMEKGGAMTLLTIMSGYSRKKQYVLYDDWSALLIYYFLFYLFYFYFAADQQKMI